MQNTGGRARSLDEILRAQSSSLLASVITANPSPTNGKHNAWDRSVPPVPAVGFSIKWNGVGPDIKPRQNGSNMAAQACAFDAAPTKGKSPISSSMRSFANDNSDGDGRAETS